jgi:hypothetical protein
LAVLEHSAPDQGDPSGIKNYSALVEALLIVNDHENALAAARRGVINLDVLERLAIVLEMTHPVDTVDFYRRMIPAHVAVGDKTHYVTAARLTRRMLMLCARLGIPQQAHDFLIGLRIKFKVKRSFIKLIEDFQPPELAAPSSQ